MNLGSCLLRICLLMIISVMGYRWGFIQKDWLRVWLMVNILWFGFLSFLLLFRMNLLCGSRFLCWLKSVRLSCGLSHSLNLSSWNLLSRIIVVGLSLFLNLFSTFLAHLFTDNSQMKIFSHDLHLHTQQSSFRNLGNTLSQRLQNYHYNCHSPSTQVTGYFIQS